MFVSFLSLICLAGAELQSPYAATAIRLGKYLSKSVGSPASSFGGDLVCFIALGHPQTRASITYTPGEHAGQVGEAVLHSADLHQP